MRLARTTAPPKACANDVMTSALVSASTLTVPKAHDELVGVFARDWIEPLAQVLARHWPAVLVSSREAKAAEDAKDDVVEPGAGPEQEASLDGAAGDGDEGPGMGDEAKFSGHTPIKRKNLPSSLIRS